LVTTRARNARHTDEVLLKNNIQAPAVLAGFG